VLRGSITSKRFQTLLRYNRHHRIKRQLVLRLPLKLTDADGQLTRLQLVYRLP
jgi:hypothetical protein